MHRKVWAAFLVVLVLALAAVAGTAGAGTRSTEGTQAAAPVKIGIVYSRTGLLSAYGARVPPGPDARHGVRHEGDGQDQRSSRADPVRRRRGRSREGSLRSTRSDRPGLQDHRRLARRRASRSRSRRSPRRTRCCSSRGPAATDAVTGLNRYTFRSGRQSTQDVLAAKGILGNGVGTQGRSSSRRTARSARATSRRCAPILGGAGHTVSSDPRAAVGERLHAVRAAGERGEPRPALRRLGRHDRARDVARARAAGRRSAARRSRPGLAERATWGSYVPGLELPLALRRGGAQEQGQRLAEGEDAAAKTGAGSVHARRLQRRVDARPRDRARRRHRRRAG